MKHARKGSIADLRNWSRSSTHPAATSAVTITWSFSGGKHLWIHNSADSIRTQGLYPYPSTAPSTMPPAIPRIDGPLGNLAGMYFDPSRNRYFPIPKDPPPSDQTSTLPHSSPVQSSSRLPAEYLPPTGCDIRWNKRAKLSHSASEAPPRSKTGRLVFRGRRDRDGDR